MSEITFGEHVAILAKPGHDIVNEITAEGCHFMHMALGVAGEAGELVDALKKHAIYNKPLDRDNVVEELGDLWFYMNGIMNELDIDLEEIEKFNRTKLAARYPEGYSDKAAQERADKGQLPCVAEAKTMYAVSRTEPGSGAELELMYGPYETSAEAFRAQKDYEEATGEVCYVVTLQQG